MCHNHVQRPVGKQTFVARPVGLGARPRGNRHVATVWEWCLGLSPNVSADAPFDRLSLYSIGMRVDMCVDMCVAIRIDMRADVCIDI